MAVMRSYVDEKKFEEDFERAKQKLDPNEVREITYKIGHDWDGNDVIFFRVVLADAATEWSKLGEASGRVSEIIWNETDPYGNYGFVPLFAFRSESERRAHPERRWD